MGKYGQWCYRLQIYSKKLDSNDFSMWILERLDF